MNMEIYNVLLKGVEVRIPPICKAFRTEAQADAYIQDECIKRDLTIRSTYGWDEGSTLNDYRAEDIDGNTFYFVIYRQLI